MTTPSRARGAAASLLALAAAAVPVAALALPPSAGLALSTLAALTLAAGGARRCAPWLPALLALQLVALCLLRLLGAWPCDTACQGGGYYQRLAGVPVETAGLAAYALLAALALRDLRRGAPSPALSRYAWLLAGGSLFFLWISAQLGLACPFCRAVHATMLVAAASLPPPPGAAGARRWCAALLWLAAGVLLLNLAYHHRAVPDAVFALPPGAPGDPAAAALRAGADYHTIDRGRSTGPDQARYRMVVVVDPHCRACAEEYGPLLAALTPLCTGPQPRLALATQFLVRASDASSADLARHLLATALLAPHRFRTVLRVVLGAPAGSGFAALSARIAEVDDPAEIAAAAARASAAIDLVRADDDARLALFSGRAPVAVTPQLLLVEQVPGAPPRLLRRWQGALDGEALAGEISTLIAH